MHRRLFILFFLFTGLTGISQEVKVGARLDTNAMLIGDHVGLTLSYEGPATGQVIWPFLPDTILENITVIGRGTIDTSFSADKKSIVLKQQLNLTCYDSGFYTIPGISFTYRKLPDTTRFSTETAMLLLAVHTVKVDTAQAIKPIKGPLNVPITFKEVLPFILAILIVIGMIISLIWYLKKRKKQEPVFRLKPRMVLQPHEKALQELEKLRVKKLWQEGKIKEYHSELTEILRKYIEEQFHVPALELTSGEVMDNLRKDSVCAKPALERLNGILQMADIAKFAKGKPLPDENEKSLTEGIAFINETTEKSPEIKEDNTTKL